MRLRELGLSVGTLPTGPLNAITDVTGVGVGHTTVIRGEGPAVVGEGPVRTGVTVIKPVPGHVRMTPLPAGAATLNGNGEFTGLEWVRESGLLTTPIAITNTHSVGTVRDALVSDDYRQSEGGLHWSMPLVAETFDGILNDIEGQHVKAEHVHEALANVSFTTVAEGGVGGGTGMICHGFKGGIGTSSRQVTLFGQTFTVGVLVQANHGARGDLRVDGAPVGRYLGPDVIPVPDVSKLLTKGRVPEPGTGSIIIIVATDAPLLPDQCRRLALRAFVGLSRSGGGCHDGSGDIALAFSTGAVGSIPPEYFLSNPGMAQISFVPHQVMSPLFDAASDATEEAILNAILQGKTTVGRDGITATALDGDTLMVALRQVHGQ